MCTKWYKRVLLNVIIIIKTIVELNIFSPSLSEINFVVLQLIIMTTYEISEHKHTSNYLVHSLILSTKTSITPPIVDGNVGLCDVMMINHNYWTYIELYKKHNIDSEYI